MIVIAAALLSVRLHGQCSPTIVPTYTSYGGVTLNTSLSVSSSLATFSWTFPGGSPSGSTLQSPSLTYSANGSYIAYVSIYVATLSCTYTGTVLITITNASCALNAGFVTSSGLNGTAGFTSTSIGTSSLTTYTWTLGNGTTAIGPSANTTYTANGSYTVFLNAFENPGCQSTTSAVITVTNACVLSASIGYTQTSNGGIQFFNNTTGTVTGTTYTWSFGDNTSAVSAGPAHTYSSNGTYTVTLFAMTPSGCTSFTSVVVSVNTIGCSAAFVYTVLSGGQVKFTNTSVSSSSLVAYLWHFGNSFSSTATNTTSTTYTAPGNYTVTLHLNTYAGPSCSDSATHVVAIACPLAPSFVYSITGNSQLSFTSTSGGVQAGSTYSWNFGNSYTGTGSVASTTYSVPGIYSVTLTVFTNSSPFCSATSVQSVSVTSFPCNVQPAITHTFGTGGGVRFASASSGTVAGTQYYWNFGDGYSGVGPEPWHNYTNGGTHFVSLTCTNPGTPACTATVTQALNVTGVTCYANANFSMAPLSSTGWQIIPAYPWNVTAAVWTWGDGNSSAGLYASHQYSASGNYSICLSVTVSCGESSTGCVTYDFSSGSGIAVVPPNVVAAGIEERADYAHFSIYPNPSDGQLFITGDGENKAGWTIEAYDLTGRMVATFEPANAHLDLSLPDGVYLLRIAGRNGCAAQKLIISR